MGALFDEDILESVMRRLFELGIRSAVTEPEGVAVGRSVSVVRIGISAIAVAQPRETDGEFGLNIDPLIAAVDGHAVDQQRIDGADDLNSVGVIASGGTADAADMNVSKDVGTPRCGTHVKPIDAVIAGRVEE